MNDKERKQLFSQLRDDGYEACAPSPEADAIDRQVCNESTCECGYNGMVYHPMTKPGSYRAFAVCISCGYTEEF